MPLPDSNVDWPPPETKPADRLYQQWGAWYSGDPEQLAAVYADTPGIGGDADLPKGQPTGPRFLANIARGVQRAFWGTPVTPGQVRGHKVHIPLAGDIAMTSADLLFGEPPAFTLPDQLKSPTADRLEEILDDSNSAATWLEGAETAAAYGGAYLRVSWNPVVAEHPLFDALPPDAGIPEFRSGRLVAVTLWRNLARVDGKHWRHLERHEPGRVLHGLYVSGDSGKLGRAMPLEAHPETAPFTVLVEPGDKSSIETGAKGLTCEYVPNMRPHRSLRGSPLGRSDFDGGVCGLMDALDESWTSWMRDLRLGKGRIVVPRSYLQSQGRGRGAMFDAEREVYEAVDTLESEGSGLALQVVQFGIRVEEHSRTCRELATKAIASAGYSPQTFGESDQVAATATEVVQREAASFRTRSRKINYWRGPLARIALAALEVDAAKFGTDKLKPELPVLQWPDGVNTDQEALARTLSLLQAAEATSIHTRVKLLNPDWEDVDVDREVVRIKEDAAAGAPPVPPPGSTATGQGPDGPAGGDSTSPAGDGKPPAAGKDAQRPANIPPGNPQAPDKAKARPASQ